jgi:hypothetical protein
MIHSAYGTFAIGGDLPVDRMGFGAMRLARNLMGDTFARDPTRRGQWSDALSSSR